MNSVVDNTEKREGLLIIISGPSGAGKGTVYNEVIKRRPEIQKSVSVTTRAPRPNEIEGVHYYFRTLEQYQDMKQRPFTAIITERRKRLFWKYCRKVRT